MTTFEKQESLIYLLKQYGFSLFTHKNTQKSDDKIEREAIYVKNIKDKSQYPYVQIKDQGIFIFPVIPKYHKLLFEDAEGSYQISIDDTQGKNTNMKIPAALVYAQNHMPRSTPFQATCSNYFFPSSSAQNLRGHSPESDRKN